MAFVRNNDANVVMSISNIQTLKITLTLNVASAFDE